MLIHYLQHVAFEDPAFILTWARKNAHGLSRTLLYNNETLPKGDNFDLLVIMGGPMNIYEHEKFPWLAEEKHFIKRAVTDGKKVIGICLGAQLIADVLGAEVKKGPYKEIGWFPVELSKDAESVFALRYLPDTFSAFHWHGDVFDCPKDAVLLGSSKACTNQGFMYGKKVLALQFHLESTAQSIRDLIGHCGNELVPGKYIQNSEEILKQSRIHVPVMNNLMEKLLDNWIR